MQLTKMLFSEKFLCGLDSGQLYTITIHAVGRWFSEARAAFWTLLYWTLFFSRVIIMTSLSYALSYEIFLFIRKLRSLLNFLDIRM
jgi:hypothetical protein